MGSAAAACLIDTVRASTPEDSAPMNPSQTEFYTHQSMWVHDHLSIQELQAQQLPNLHTCAELLRTRTSGVPLADRMEASIVRACRELVSVMQGCLGQIGVVFRTKLVQLSDRNAPGFKTAPLARLQDPSEMMKGMEDLALFLHRWKPNTQRLALQWWDPDTALEVGVAGLARALHALAVEKLLNASTDHSVAWSFIRARCVKATWSDTEDGAVVCELRPASAAQRAGAQALRSMRYGTAYLAHKLRDGTHALFRSRSEMFA
jgi:hypothetical protein